MNKFETVDGAELSVVIGGKKKHNGAVAKCASMIGIGAVKGAIKGASTGAAFGQPISAGAGAFLGGSLGTIGGSFVCGGWLLGGK